MKSNFQQNIIAKQLIRKVSLFAGMVAVLLTSVMGFISYRIEVNNFSQQFDEIKDSYLDVIRTALWIDDKETINTVLIGICTLPGIQHAHIHLKDGVVCEAGNMKMSEKWNRSFPIRHVYKGKSLQLGELHVQGNAQYLHKKIINMILAIAVAQTISILLICCLLLWMMHKDVIDRVLKITSYTSSLTFENINIPLVLSSKKEIPDELDALIDGINERRERLHQAYIREKKAEEELKKSHDFLEETVEERTKELNKTVKQLQDTLSEIKVLSGLIPICSHCKKIRDDEGYWNVLESYIQEYSDASFSHSLCPECSDELYGDEDWYIEMKKGSE